MSEILTNNERTDIEKILEVCVEYPEIRKSILLLAQGLIAGAMLNGRSKDIK